MPDAVGHAFREALESGRTERALALLKRVSGEVRPRLERTFFDTPCDEIRSETESAAVEITARPHKWRTYDPRTSALRTWFFAVVHNRIVDARRSRSRGREREQSHGVPRERHAAPLASAAEEDLIDIVTRLFARHLTELQREIMLAALARHGLVARSGEEDDEELAARLGVAVQTVWNNRSRARAVLAPYLEELFGHG